MQLDEGEQGEDDAGEESGDEAPPEIDALNEDGGEDAEPKPTDGEPEPAGPEGVLLPSHKSNP